MRKFAIVALLVLAACGGEGAFDPGNPETDGAGGAASSSTSSSSSSEPSIPADGTAPCQGGAGPVSVPTTPSAPLTEPTVADAHLLLYCNTSQGIRTYWDCDGSANTTSCECEGTYNKPGSGAETPTDGTPSCGGCQGPVECPDHTRCTATGFIVTAPSGDEAEAVAFWCAPDGT